MTRYWAWVRLDTGQLWILVGLQMLYDVTDGRHYVTPPLLMTYIGLKIGEGLLWLLKHWQQTRKAARYACEEQP